MSTWNVPLILVVVEGDAAPAKGGYTAYTGLPGLELELER
jgi:hypothetical protein